MKNAMSYFYNLEPNDIHQKDNDYYFEINNEFYYLELYKRKIEDLKPLCDLNYELLTKGIYTHQIVYNNMGKPITDINNKMYVLLKSYSNLDSKVAIKDITVYQNYDVKENKNLKRDDWALLWSNKIDYFEYQVNQFGKKHPIIRESFSYFVGLAETGIQLFTTYYQMDEKLKISHERIKDNDSLFKLYNPLNFVFDNKVRDICEYFKDRFLKCDNLLEEIIEYLKYTELTNYEMIMFYIRMLYPSFYFDIYEDVLTDKKKEQELINCIKKIDDYEYLLKTLYNYLSNYIKMPNIEWIKKL